MFLIIDNTEDEKITFYFLLNNKFVQRTYSTNKNKSILVCLDKFLSYSKSELKDIKYLGVVLGEGRFTASRLAVTVANTLAYGLKIPVIALPKNFNQSDAFELAKLAVVGKYIIPTYSGVARIG